MVMVMMAMAEICGNCRDALLGCFHALSRDLPCPSRGLACPSRDLPCTFSGTSLFFALIFGDETWGEKVVAYAVVKAGQSLTLEELDAHLRDRLAGYKIPRELYILDALPRNASGKVVKTDLRDIYADN